MSLSHRERVRAVLSGEHPDRPVVDLGGRVASLSTPAYLELKTHLGYGEGLTDETVTLLNTIGCFDERVLQYFDSSHSTRFLVPLLALHPMQHLAIFSRVTMRASLMMCSHDGLSRRLALCAVKSTPQ